MDHKRIAAMFAMASILVLASSIATTRLVPGSLFAAQTAAAALSDSSPPTVAIQHIPNSSSSNSLTIETLTVTAKAMKTIPASNVQVQIVGGEDGKVKGSAKLASSLFSLTTYNSITAKFDPPVKVKG